MSEFYKMEIAGLDVVCENEIEGIVLTGSIGSSTEPFDFKKEINKYFKDKYDLKVISSESGAIGAAQIAMDVYGGVEEILGIEVNISWTYSFTLIKIIFPPFTVSNPFSFSNTRFK